MPEQTKLEIVRAGLKSIEDKIVLLEPVTTFDLFNEKYYFPVDNVDFFVAPQGEMITAPKQLNAFLDSLAIKDLEPTSSSHFDWIGAETLQLGFHQYNEIIGKYTKLEEITIETHDKETEQRLKESREPTPTISPSLSIFKKTVEEKKVLTRIVTVRPCPNENIAKDFHRYLKGGFPIQRYLEGFPRKFRPPYTSQ